MPSHSQINHARWLKRIYPYLALIFGLWAGTAQGTTFTVNTLDDVVNGSDAFLSFREAISAANTDPDSNDVIDLKGLTGNISLSSTNGPFTVAGNVQILAPGADKLAIAGTGVGTGHELGVDNVLVINSGKVVIRDLGFKQLYANQAIVRVNNAQLFLSDCIFDSTGTGQYGAVAAPADVSSEIVVHNCAFVDNYVNTELVSTGGSLETGIVTCRGSTNTLHLVNTTISGSYGIGVYDVSNIVDGAISTRDGCNTLISFSTLVNNQTGGLGGNAVPGVRSSVIAFNRIPDGTLENCRGLSIPANDDNAGNYARYVGSGTTKQRCGFPTLSLNTSHFEPDVNNNNQPTVADNGGGTFTARLIRRNNNPAVYGSAKDGNGKNCKRFDFTIAGVGENMPSILRYDQRRFPRSDMRTCDAGAYQSQPIDPPCTAISEITQSTRCDGTTYEVFALNDLTNFNSAPERFTSSLVVKGDLDADEILIDAPCGVQVDKSVSLNANLLDIHTADKIELANHVNITGGQVCLTSIHDKIDIGKSLFIDLSGDLEINSGRWVRLGAQGDISAKDIVLRRWRAGHVSSKNKLKNLRIKGNTNLSADQTFALFGHNVKLDKNVDISAYTFDDTQVSGTCETSSGTTIDAERRFGTKCRASVRIACDGTQTHSSCLRPPPQAPQPQ